MASSNKAPDEPRLRRWLRAAGIRAWFVVLIGVLPAVASVAVNILLVRLGMLDGVAPWQLLLGFAVLAYVTYWTRDRLPLWDRIANDPRYKTRQIRRHASQLLRVTRRALGRPWYRRRVAPPVVAEIRSAVDALAVALRARQDTETLDAHVDRLEKLFDKHLAFMKVSVYVEYVGQIALAVLVALVLKESLVEAFKIPSGSMLPTLEVGDHIFVNKLQYGIHFPFTHWLPIDYGSPARGDVVVFTEPGKGGEDFIKRVVAVAGDHIRVESDGTLMVNGRTVRRCSLGVVRAPLRDDQNSPTGSFDVFVESLDGVRYAIRQIHDPSGGTRSREGRPAYRDVGGGLLLVAAGDQPPGRPFPRRPIHTCPGGRPSDAQGCLVPDGTVFVMGDNRDNSNDSRFWGIVPLGNIKGKAMFIWWSNANRTVETDRIGILIHDGVEVVGEGLTDEERRCLTELEKLPPGTP